MSVLKRLANVAKGKAIIARKDPVAEARRLLELEEELKRMPRRPISQSRPTAPIEPADEPDDLPESKFGPPKRDEKGNIIKTL